VAVCQFCRAVLEEGDRCEDVGACSKRAASKLSQRLSRLNVKPFVGGFDPEKAYREADKGSG